jgi:hypothetical protein
MECSRFENADNVLSRTGFVICYANCPIVWCSKLQSEIALSMAEAEYIAMSHVLRETILIQNLIKETSHIFHTPNPMTDLCITLHKDNISAIAMAESLKFTPRTKHIAISTKTFAAKSILHLPLAALPSAQKIHLLGYNTILTPQIVKGSPIG